MFLKCGLLLAMAAYLGSCAPSDCGHTSVVSSSNVVSNNVYQILAENSDNVLFCPVSFNLLLSLTTLGARQKTKEELRSGLALSNDDEEIKCGYKTLLQEFQNSTLKLATRLFPKTGVTLVPDFLTIAQTYFNSDVEIVDYNNPSNAANIINSFVEKETNNKIKDLINPDALSSATRLTLVNAAHFKDEWLYKFDYVLDGDFYPSKDKKVVTKMMTVTERYNYAESSALNAKVLQMPFKTQGYSMVFILPNADDGLQALETKFASVNIEDVIKELTVKKVITEIPKYKIESTLALNDVLEKMGIKEVFTDEADLTGIISAPLISVSKVIQKTYMDVNENGVEAAAATAIIAVESAILDTEPIEEFKADRPFMFFLMYKKLVLFSGKLANV